MNQGEKVRKIREIKGYSQDYMAAKLGITQPSYARIERGETKLNTDRLEEIAKLLEVKPEDILNYDSSIVFHHVNNSQIGYRQENNVTQEANDSKAVKILEQEVNDLRNERDKLLGIIEKMSK
jgi:transcriptional regulator with XRE-family HTH domain